jgi:phosphohistidine phosphatase
LKHLFILRHAKSSWDESYLADFDRPLNERGMNAAPFMGEFIAKQQIFPDVFLSSPAKRAMQTAQLVKDSSGFNVPLRFDERVYEASPLSLLQVISEVENSIGSVMLIGHNPGIEGLIRILTGQLEAMPTAALAMIDLDIHKWSDACDGSGVLTAVYRPRELMKTAAA